ncbi:DUF6765 family protein [Pectinatus sottacetonis]|uniref:DUF6765 family protein n=1 Tax=Pectinatus sottacetonis TaxID=1002795 RepID=UPI0018C8181C|nr:DUF6765 family protein [Pectinatus sottacetonis]
MDIDFHFAVIYILSRWAGFTGKEAKIIATSSQLVDDNVNHNISSVNKSYELCDFGIRRFSGHRNWENLSETGNKNVWIPFHFLPGLEGKTMAEKLICKKDSILSNELIQKIYQRLAKTNLCRIGIILHVYADTWAHQEFSGITSCLNVVTDINIINADNKLSENWKSNTADFFTNLKPLGHASAIHWPDRPYAYWQSHQKFFYGRKNWQEFQEAIAEIYKALSLYNRQKSYSLEYDKMNKLSYCLQTIKDKNCYIRNNKWLKLINNNYFAFEKFSLVDRTLNYDKNFIINNKEYKIDFYSAIQEHYQWVKNRLDDFDIDINGIPETFIDLFSKWQYYFADLKLNAFYTKNIRIPLVD